MRPSRRAAQRKRSADVILLDGTNVNHTLVKNGWWYRKYAPGDKERASLAGCGKLFRLILIRYSRGSGGRENTGVILTESSALRLPMPLVL